MALVAEIERSTLQNARLIETDFNDLGANGARLRIDNFAMTANNVTYALMGERMGYWTFFPASLGWGVVPVWGHATVEASNHEMLKPGERLYGFLPMASHVDIEVGGISNRSIEDISAHRSQMSPFYNRYRRLGADTPVDPRSEMARALFQPLFATSVLIEHMFRDADWHGAEQLVVTSASSKTAIALAWAASKLSPNITRIGMTSAANRDHVIATGLFDHVVAYDEASELPDRPSVFVDIAGDAKAREDVHIKLQENLRYSCGVGATHGPQRRKATGAPLPGPAPASFFAPSQWEVAAASGTGQFEADLASHYAEFIADVDNLVRFETREGLPAAIEAYRSVLAGTADPASAITIRL